LRDGSNQHAWDQCVQVYLPLIIGFCRQQGLQEADAKDVAQEVLLTLFSRMQNFDYSRAKGRFRSWILAVTRNKLADYFRRLSRHNEA
jgi:RNA polymerase sigma-70 factor (ECF subfamily)